jgi:hypothetical protein
MKYAAPMTGVIKYAVPLFAALLIAGCAKPKDIAFYKSHPADRGKKIEACSGSGDTSEDCNNAKQAETEAYADDAVAYYKSHPADLAKHFQACSSSGDTSDDCKNAERAEAETHPNGGVQPVSLTTTAKK